jgi:tetratricopeptide (TPR) repeat protein
VTTSSDLAQTTKEYDRYINERLKEFDAHILYGRILMTNLAEYTHALALFHYLLRTINPDSKERANVYFELAHTYRFQGEHEKAMMYFHAALSLQCRQLPESRFACGTILAGIATVDLEMGDSKNALSVLEQSNVCFSEYPFDYNYETIFQCNRLSYAYYLEGEYELALDILAVALQFYERKMPSNHPSHAQAYHNIGLVERALGNMKEAQDAFREALRMRLARLSSDHPYIARTHYQLS